MKINGEIVVGLSYLLYDIDISKCISQASFQVLEFYKSIVRLVNADHLYIKELALSSDNLSFIVSHDNIPRNHTFNDLAGMQGKD